MGKRGLSLLEIIVASLILALVMVGLVNIFFAGKRYILHARSRMVGGELGKYFLDPLQMYVRQDTWNDAAQNCLGAGNCPDQAMGSAQGLDRDYTGRYAITNNFPAANVNKVRVSIMWNELQP